MCWRLRVARVLVFSCVALSVTCQQGYNGENRRTVPCTKAETARSATAFNQLSMCTGVTLEDLKKSFITQNQDGAVVGSLRIERVNECLWRIKNGSHIDDECRKSIQEVADEADHGSDTPSSKVAAMLMDDPEEFCSCVRAVNITGIECPGWGVVAAVRNLTETCDLLQTPEVQEELRRNAQQQLDDAYQEAVRNGTIDGSWVNRTNGSRSPSSGNAPSPLPPTLAPTAPSPQQPQSPSAHGNPGGGAGWNHQLDDNALKCFQKFLSACPNLNGKSAQVVKCAERAVKKGELDAVCLQIIENYADPIGADSGGGRYCERGGQPGGGSVEPHHRGADAGGAVEREAHARPAGLHRSDEQGLRHRAVDAAADMVREPGHHAGADQAHVHAVHQRRGEAWESRVTLLDRRCVRVGASVLV